MIIEQGIGKAKSALESLCGEPTYTIEMRVIDNVYAVEALDIVKSQTQGYLVSNSGNKKGLWAVCTNKTEIAQAIHALKGGQ